jgi:hypothetical protein
MNLYLEQPMEIHLFATFFHTQETSYVLKVKRCQSVLNTKNVKRDRV